MVQLTFHVTDDDAERLREEAIRDGRTQSQVVRLALKAHFDALDKKRARRVRNSTKAA
jgi:hypothetical protein